MSVYTYFANYRSLCPFFFLGSGPYQSRRSKIAAVLDYLSERFLEVYSPGRELSADESTVPFKGRVSFRCYNAKKPTKWGLRIYDIADASTGYMLAAIPYFGKGTVEALGHSDKPFMSRIILALTEKVLEKTGDTGYHVFTDRLYTSTSLAKELGKKGVHFTGTIQTNRQGLPQEMRNGKVVLRKGDMKSFIKNNRYHLLSWRDKRTVTLLSTYYNNSRRVHRRNRKGTNDEVISKPEIVEKYTEHMGGVDKHDHLVSSYRFLQKSLKWWKKLFFFLLEFSVINSFILFNLFRREKGLPSVKHRIYRKFLIQELVGNNRNKNAKRRGRPSTGDEQERLSGTPHFLGKFEGRRSRQCLVCSDRNGPGGRRETVFFCSTCSRHPALHPTECFKIYHTKTIYKRPHSYPI